MEIIFATSNSHKVIEATKAIGDEFTLIMPKELGFTKEIPETGKTLEDNAIQKCRFLWDRFERACFADDTGLETDALNGDPGVYTARYAGVEGGNEANMEKLLSELEQAEKQATEKGLPIPARTARFRTITALIQGGQMHLFEGVLEGKIAREKSGTQGFGYDPVFIPEGYTQTLAELSLDEKNKISHRGKAMRKLAEFLRK